MGQCLRPAMEQGELVALVSTGIIVMQGISQQYVIVHFFSFHEIFRQVRIIILLYKASLLCLDLTIFLSQLPKLSPKPKILSRLWALAPKVLFLSRCLCLYLSPRNLKVIPQPCEKVVQSWWCVCVYVCISQIHR